MENENQEQEELFTILLDREDIDYITSCLSEACRNFGSTDDEVVSHGDIILIKRRLLALLGDKDES